MHEGEEGAQRRSCQDGKACHFCCCGVEDRRVAIRSSTMKKSEILRITRLCLKDEKNQLNGAQQQAEVHDESDLQVTTIQSLWGGMGHIYRVSWKNLNNSSQPCSLILKHVAPPSRRQNNSINLSDQRKADSYQVECNFYQHVAPDLILSHGLSLPRPYLVERHFGKSKTEMAIAMSYVSSCGVHATENDWTTFQAILTWLATLHAAHWGHEAADAVVERAGLQPCGTYWYLDTRPDEHARMANHGWEGRLKRAARAIDARLERDPSLQCILHGDAKDANILRSRHPETGATVVTFCDFQYCGKGAPTKDLAYLFSTTSIVQITTRQQERDALEFYWQQLTQRLTARVHTPPPTLEELSDSLELAYCDFVRFMAGWGYWGSSSSVGRVKAVLDRLDGGKDLGSENAYHEAVQREYG